MLISYPHTYRRRPEWWIIAFFDSQSMVTRVYTVWIFIILVFGLLMVAPPNCLPSIHPSIDDCRQNCPYILAVQNGMPNGFIQLQRARGGMFSFGRTLISVHHDLKLVCVALSHFNPIKWTSLNR